MGLFGKKEDPEDLMYQAMAFLEKNQPKAAATLFKKVTKVEPENVNAWYNQGLALNQLKKYADAENPTTIIRITPTVNFTFNPMILSPSTLLRIVHL